MNKYNLNANIIGKERTYIVPAKNLKDAKIKLKSKFSKEFKNKSLLNFINIKERKNFMSTTSAVKSKRTEIKPDGSKLVTTMKNGKREKQVLVNSKDSKKLEKNPIAKKLETLDKTSKVKQSVASKKSSQKDTGKVKDQRNVADEARKAKRKEEKETKRKEREARAAENQKKREEREANRIARQKQKDINVAEKETKRKEREARAAENEKKKAQRKENEIVRLNKNLSDLKNKIPKKKKFIASQTELLGKMEIKVIKFSEKLEKLKNPVKK